LRALSKTKSLEAGVTATGGAMRSLVEKRSIVLAGRNTSVSLEEPFWEALKDIATSRQSSLSDLISAIDLKRKHGNLSSALRLFVLNHYRRQGDRRTD
jgi:predicted DNA-binding ribbon-helix-helix protein